jgi:glucose/arabinose dehydrogenase
MDLLLTAAPQAGRRVIASHHYWDAERRCTGVRLSAFEGEADAFLDGQAPERWKTLWQTADCLPLDLEGERFFAGHQAGGTLLQQDERHLLIALGDQGFDGLSTRRAVSQDPASEYGKITSVDLSNGASRTYASGLRSPGDLYRDPGGEVWFLDHGPRGGDELNRLRNGANYGWPCRTLGAPYEGFGWRPPARGACSRTFTDPVFAWTPSIGTATLIGLDGPGFDAWRGDLLVGGLASRNLAHVVRLDGRPVLSEPIPLNERVRDLAQEGSGRIVLWTDSGALISLEAGDPSSRF